ncbi:ABC transporter permease [Fulvivirgaceae bacterium BMA12]|uniref:ABC transporter permease n=1 Tax=Agaribacillus aureus TaxID=3051825 RepID=A0ABT8L0Q4_9BACT|nr:ABC transporter permease [Fulvivirgaceae bacterium BMA12]
MLKNYLKIAFRNLFKEKVFSFINIFGLAMGMAAFLLILQYVVFEKSYDKFFEKADHIYRVQLNQFRNNELFMRSAENYPAVGPALKAELPEVLDYARLYNLGYKNNIVITYEDGPAGPVRFKHRRFMYADSSFLPMFGYQVIAGDPATTLSRPNTTAISETYAKKYFGDADPIGKNLRLQDDDFNDETCEVTAVFKDLPKNTHLKFDILFSYKTLFGRFENAPDRYDRSWQRKDMYTYLLVRPETDPDLLSSKFAAIVDKYNPDQDRNSFRRELKLQPIKDIHLHSNLAEEVEINGDANRVLFLSIIGFFILFIAWVNYINLATAKALERAGEVGVRKSMGAFKNQLITQFMVESGLINLLAIILSMVILLLALPYFNRIIGVENTATYLLQPWFGLTLLGLWLVGTLLSGVYPSFVLSSFHPVTVLKGKLRNSGNGVFFRKSLVTFQFMASVVLIGGTLTVYQQMNYIMNQDIGMKIDQILTIERPSVASRDRAEFASNIKVFRDELLQSPSIKAVSATGTIPGHKREYKIGVKKYGAPDDNVVILRWNSMDHDFMDVFEMELLAGRVFSEDFVNDPDTSLVLSVSAAKLLGFDNPEDIVGQTLEVPQFGWKPIVVGVVNDYHQESLKKQRDPMAFYCTINGGEYYSMSISTNNFPQTIEHVRASWEKAFPGNPFDYFFLDDYFNRQYQNEQNFGSLFGLFAIIALIVGCLGLYGLSAYTAQRKTKEIGVRKVLGSSVSGIMALLSKEFLQLIIIACVLGLPLVYFIMDNWLQDFATRVRVNWLLLLLASLTVVIVAFFAMSYQTLKAARLNPVDSLKYE